ncbi:sugar-binding transcriptional regulator [Paenochrobactrum pullorum]|uniref:sugar-binding transcriptional regulator n=1 Tax=Paenochrobactrum pullorum TaxID=1324351 RepID=UPI0035BBF082
MSLTPMNRADTDLKSDDAVARAGWLYYAGGMTQDQVAAEMGISRQRAQRLVSRAVASGIIKVRLEHPIAACLELEARLRERYGLIECRVVPMLGAGADPAHVIAPAAAALFEKILARTEPQVIGVGTGRALRAMADELQKGTCDRHRLVSLIGNISTDGSATMFEVILYIASRLNAPHYPMPVPVISSNREERDAFLTLKPVQAVHRLGRKADVIFVGVGQMNHQAPLFLDGFVSEKELDEVHALGGIGEVAGHIYDHEGHYIESEIHDRMAGIRVEAGLERLAVGIAAGASKIDAIRGALKGRIINGLVTDEATAIALL